MNKMQTKERHRPNSAPKEKTVTPYICRSIFQTNYPIADYYKFYKFYKNTNPLQVIPRKIRQKPLY